MRLFLDANIFLEIILEQEHAGQARTLLSRTRDHEFFMSDYSLHSIGLLLFRQNKHGIFRKFFNDIILNAGIEVISVPTDDMEVVITVAQRFNLNFDDAYQYVAADTHNLVLVSFDVDFDRTEFGRKTPAQILGR